MALAVVFVDSLSSGAPEARAGADVHEVAVHPGDELIVEFGLPGEELPALSEGLEGVETLSAFRSSFGNDYGVTMADGPMKGLFARSVIVLNADGNVAYSELVDDIVHEPNYDAAIAALG